MANLLKPLVFVCLAATLVGSPAIGQYYYGTGASIRCGCDLHEPMPRVQVYERSNFREYAVQTQSSPVVEYAPARAATPRFSRQYYSPEEAQVLYHPVVVPLDEFLRPGQPISLTPEQLARQRAAAAARVTPPPQIAAPAASTSDADPFANDAAAEPTAAREASIEAAEAADEDVFAEDVMPAEQPAADRPEAESTSEPTAMPESEPADAGEDPFDL